MACIFLDRDGVINISEVRNGKPYAPKTFSDFNEKIIICLMHYLTIDYLCNDLKPIVKKVVKPPDKTLFYRDNSSNQTTLAL